MLVSLFRGFVSEIISTISWFVGLILSVKYYIYPAAYLDFISNPYLRNLAGILILFFIILFVGGIINFLIGKFIHKTGLSGVDRVLGMCFGFIRGVLIVGALLFVASYFAKLQEIPVWKESLLVPEFNFITDWLAIQAQSIKI